MGKPSFLHSATRRHIVHLHRPQRRTIQVGLVRLNCPEFAKSRQLNEHIFMVELATIRPKDRSPSISWYLFDIRTRGYARLASHPEVLRYRRELTLAMRKSTVPGFCDNRKFGQIGSPNTDFSAMTLRDRIGSPHCVPLRKLADI